MKDVQDQLNESIDALCELILQDFRIIYCEIEAFLDVIECVLVPHLAVKNHLFSVHPV